MSYISVFFSFGSTYIFGSKFHVRIPEVANLCKPTTVSANIIFESITLFTLLLVQYRTKICHFLGKIFSGTYIFGNQNPGFTYPETHKLQEKHSALKREHPAFKAWKFFTFFYICGSFLSCWIRIRIQQLKLMLIHPDPFRIHNPGTLLAGEKLTIYAPMIYTAPCIMFWMCAYPLRGEVGGRWALE